jgi:uncharacterized membrane protein YdbT with pleckstrin-like domain
MAYITKELTAGERLVALNRPSWWTIAPRTLLTIALLVVAGVIAYLTGVADTALFWTIAVPVAFLIWIVMTVGLAVRVMTTEIAVTDVRVMSKTGLVNIEVKTTPLDKVNNVNVVQSVFGRMLDYGDIEVTTATAEENDNHFVKTLARPKAFRDNLTSIQDEANDPG